MTWLDIILIFALLSYVWGGFSAGLIQELGGLLGLIIGSIVASRTYEHFGSIAAQWFGGSQLVGQLVAFAAILLIVSRAVAIIVWFINKLFNVIAIVPGLKLLNKFSGAVLGFLEGAIYLGLTLQLVNRLPNVPDAWVHALQSSFMVSFLLHFAAWLVPFLPKALKESQKALDRFIPSAGKINLPTNIPL